VAGRGQVFSCAIHAPFPDSAPIAQTATLSNRLCRDSDAPDRGKWRETMSTGARYRNRKCPAVEPRERWPSPACGKRNAKRRGRPRPTLLRERPAQRRSTSTRRTPTARRKNANRFRMSGACRAKRKRCRNGGNRTHEANTGGIWEPGPILARRGPQNRGHILWRSPAGDRG